jgi:hypothetical protein
MLEMSQAGRPIDLVTLSDHLGRQSLIDKAGGAGYLAALTDGVPIGTNATPLKEYCGIITEKSTLRKMANACENLLARIQQGVDSPATLLEAALSQFEELQLPRHNQTVPGVLASQVKTEKISWLWRDWIPRCEITMLDGDPGMGKSAITIDLAARVTQGWTMPDGSESQASASGAVIVSTEDTAATTIVPRLRAAGADLRRVRIVTEIVDAQGIPGEPELAKHECQIESAIADVSASLLIVDPLVASLDVRMDAYKDQEVRKNLAVVKRLAVRTGIAVLGLRHFSKSGGPSPIYRGQGSIAFTGAARSVLQVGRDPDDQSQRILAVAKSNLAVLPPSRRYQLGPPNDVVRVAWEGESSRTAVDLLIDNAGEEEVGLRGFAREFLEGLLAEGPVPSQEVFIKGKREGLSERTLRRAQKDLGIKPKRLGGGRDGKWQWDLPKDGQPTG